VRRKLGPALAHVRRAATIVGLEAKDVALGRVIGIDRLRRDLADGLVGLLVILVCPHVRRKGRWQRVIGDALEPVAQVGIGHHAQQHLQGVHHLDHGAQLRALGGIAPGQMLVTGKDP